MLEFGPIHKKRVNQKSLTIGYCGLAIAITFPSLFITFTTCLARLASPLSTICKKVSNNHLQPEVEMVKKIKHTYKYKKSELKTTSDALNHNRNPKVPT